MYYRLAEETSRFEFGSVSIDEPNGMALAQRVGALEAGIPSVWAYMKQGSPQGTLVWTGEEAPTYTELVQSFRKVLPATASRLKSTAS